MTPPKIIAHKCLASGDNETRLISGNTRASAIGIQNISVHNITPAKNLLINQPLGKAYH